MNGSWEQGVLQGRRGHASRGSCLMRSWRRDHRAATSSAGGAQPPPSALKVATRSSTSASSPCTRVSSDAYCARSASSTARYVPRPCTYRSRASTTERRFSSAAETSASCPCATTEGRGFLAATVGGLDAGAAVRVVSNGRSRSVGSTWVMRSMAARHPAQAPCRTAVHPRRDEGDGEMT